MKILRYPNVRLITKCDLVTPEEISSSEFTERCAELIDVMIAHGGYGLAANQIGWMKRVFALCDSSSLDNRSPNLPCLCLVNPEIVSFDSEEITKREEGCLSFPGVTCVLPMKENVTVKWISVADGLVKQSTFTDMDGRCCQHEIDHLNGKLMIDRMGKLTRRDFLRRYSRVSRLR